MNGRKVVEMNLTGAPITSDQAAALGLVTYSVPREELTPTLEKIVTEISHISPVSNSSFKRIRRAEIPTMRLDTAYMELFRTITSEEFQEGAQAFLAKRAPDYYQ